MSNYNNDRLIELESRLAAAERKAECWEIQSYKDSASLDEAVALLHQTEDKCMALRAERDEAVACISNALEALSDGDNAGAHLILYGWSQKATKP